MHSEFADWYRVVSIEPRDVNLKARWEGVKVLVDAAKPKDIVQLALLAYGLRPASEFMADFRSAFKKQDDLFAMQDNIAELQVLAASVLQCNFEYDEWGEAASLAIVTGAYCNTRPFPVERIYQLAQEHLRNRSRLLRTEKMAELPSPEESIDVEAVKKVLLANGALNTAADSLGSSLQRLQAQIDRLAGWGADISRQSAIRREESDVLWWIFGGYSRDLNIPFSNLKTPSACLIAAKELNDLTAQAPGPYAIRAFLAKILREAQGEMSLVSLADAIAACPPDWLNATPELSQQVIPELMPCRCATMKAKEVSGDPAWALAVRNVTGLDPAAKHKPIDLAEHAYREWMLGRALDLLTERHNGG